MALRISRNDNDVFSLGSPVSTCSYIPSTMMFG